MFISRKVATDAQFMILLIYKYCWIVITAILVPHTVDSYITHLFKRNLQDFHFNNTHLAHLISVKYSID